MALNRFEPIDIVQLLYFPGFTIIHAILIHKESLRSGRKCRTQEVSTNHFGRKSIVSEFKIPVFTCAPKSANENKYTNRNPIIRINRPSN